VEWTSPRSSSRSPLPSTPKACWRLNARHDDGWVDFGDDQTRPILLAVADNGP